MKFLVTLLVTVALFVSALITAQNNTITVTVVNATSDSGKIGFALHNKTSFLKMGIQSKNAKIINGKSTVTFKNVSSGEYAIVCFHDKNNNDKMDFAANGMPLEDYGSSNNDMTLGPPNFEKAKFVVADKNVSLDIKF
ncbi:hypothetical protein LPB03_01920 [Polaribacter vadi]|uniref:DUF2141 domain-containing protein n=1 Tax=Polaribacter vadi TaxID=1774273 RepID=A0A1B8U0J0_9FLAO|nr:DUF2141 domain-containing protein [Polaribacter vadi]AOW16294.1 hypothetical protein LPB03_01920 [Polaribacter vadi]OBY65380.1 hypothetical protein LPB3_03190 [Polaribacter vadi]